MKLLHEISQFRAAQRELLEKKIWNNERGGIFRTCRTQCCWCSKGAENYGRAIRVGGATDRMLLDPRFSKTLSVAS